MDWIVGNYKISTDKSLLSLQKIKELLSKSYWASDRSIEIIEKSVRNSDCYGVYYNSEQVGFARVVSDYATVYWICDVYVDENHRGNGLGKELIRCITESDDFKEIRGILATKDAHGLYKQFGFGEAAEGRFMMRPLYK